MIPRVTLHPSRNIGLKLLSLLLAASLWFIIAREETSEAVFKAPLEFINVPSSLEIGGDPPNQVQIRIRAASTVMRKIYETGLVTRVDLRSAKPGTRQISFNSDNFELPFGCQVIRIIPTGFDLTIEERDNRVVSVSPRIEGRVADGYEILSVTATPSRVRVEGPRSRVARLTSVTTEAVSVEGLVTSMSQRTALVVPDPLCRTPDENSAQLDILIVEKQEYRTIEGVAVEAVPSSRPTTTTPDRVQIRIQGPISKLRWLQPDEVRARVDVADLPAGQHNLAPRIVFSTYPDSTFKVLEIRPATVRVAVR